jgi:oxygen-independent coproporphyrinogen-3 oxidase
MTKVGIVEQAQNLMAGILSGTSGPAAEQPRQDCPRWWWPRSAYVHIPFCNYHCGYCDFAVATGQDDKIDLYIDALAAELSRLGQPQPVETLFLGGGTPTHLDEWRLERLLALVRHWLPLTVAGEFSVEANPGTLNAAKIAALARHGVNRVSLGAQSFQPHLLHVLERDHQPPDVPRAVDLLRAHIPRLSLDLIFGVPGQTMSEWDADLRQALALHPEHMSTYGLTFEKGTRLWKQMRQGQLQPLAEETELALYLHGIDTLTAAGFEHYEISNFARPGCRSRHNQVYWANEAHFGFGMGAAHYIQGRRELNSRDLTTYIRRTLAGESAVFQSEELQPEERARETMGQNLRRAEGISRTEFRQQTGFDLDALAGPTICTFVASGHLHDDGQRVYLTRAGKCVADHVIQHFWK